MVAQDREYITIQVALLETGTKVNPEPMALQTPDKLVFWFLRITPKYKQPNVNDLTINNLMAREKTSRRNPRKDRLNSEIY